MGIDIIQTIKDAASALPVDSVRRAQLELAGQRIEMLQEQIVALKEENAHLKEAAAEFRAKLKSYEEREFPKEFEEAGGALFKRKPGGGYHDAVYCPSCRIPAGLPMEGVFGYVCPKCKWSVGLEIKRLIKTLP